MTTSYVYLQNADGTPLMPSTRFPYIRSLLSNGKAVVVDKSPFTIRLKEQLDKPFVDDLMLGLDGGRTNVGISVTNKKGKCFFLGHLKSRNKEIPKLMRDRKAFRMASRRGERKVKQRMARKNGTDFLGSEVRSRYLPLYETPITVKYIKNHMARYCNRKKAKGWLTPTATQLLLTHINFINKICQILPVKYICLEVNKFSFMRMNNPFIKDWQYQRGRLYGEKDIHSAIYKEQDGVCLLCGKKEIEHYHHLVPKSEGGSDTIDNQAGICNGCHDKVHKDSKAKTKLLEKKQGLLKKYGALSILNQILPYFLEYCIKQFGMENVFTCSGSDTFTLREHLELPKDHSYDAYCISINGWIQKENGLLDEWLHGDTKTSLTEVNSSTILKQKVYEYQQFRRHNRANIHCQTERTYKLNRKIVAKNRRKRTGQIEVDSLHDWYVKTKQKFGKQQAKHLQKQLIVTKSKRRYRDTNGILPGAVFLYDGKQYVLTGTLTNGAYYRAYNEGNRNFPAKKCTIVKRNAGIVCVN